MRDNHITRSNEELYAIEKKWTNKVMANIKFVKQCHQKKKKKPKWKVENQDQTYFYFQIQYWAV